MKLTKDFNLNKILRVLITIQLIILPFLDMIRTTTLRHIEVFGVTIIELVNILLIGFSLILTIIKIFNNRKKDIFILFFLIIIYLIYIVIHYHHIVNFDINIFPLADFNFLREAFYITRVYILPLILLFILCENRDIFDKEFYLKIARIVISIISFSIIILDLLKLSFISYSPTNDFITHNFFDYFLFRGDFKLLTARGWFDSANELSAILLMLYPINVYNFYLKQDRYNFILLFCQFFSMILLGTRTAALSPLLINIFLVCSYFLIAKINGKKLNSRYLKNIFIITLCCGIYLCISPFMIARIKDMKYDFSIKNQDAYQELENIKNINMMSSLELEQLDLIMKKYANEYLINEEFLILYPFSGDREFWINIARRNRAINNNSRIMKTDIIRRIEERNNDKLDKYLGLGYTLNFMDLERDYVYQYYLFGIVGLILFICPYILILLRYGVHCMKNIKEYFNFSSLISLMCPTIGLIIAYLSGHVFGWVSPMMWLVFVFGFANYNIINNENIN